MADKEGFQFKAFIAKEFLNLDARLTDARLRPILLNPKNLAKMAAQKAVPDSVNNMLSYIKEIREKYGSPEAVRKQRSGRVDSIREMLGKPSKTSQRRAIRNALEDLGDGKQFSIKKNQGQIADILKTLDKLGDKKTKGLVEKMLSSSTNDRIKTSSGDFKSVLNSLRPDRMRGDSSSRSTFGNLSSSLGGSSESGSSPELQEKTYALLDKNFKEVIDYLKKINNGINGLEGGGVVAGGGLLNKVKTAAKGGAGYLAAGLGLASKAIKVAPVAVAGYQEYGKEKMIDRAVAAGLFTPEEAEAAKKRSRVQKASAAVLGTAGAIGGGVMGSVIPVVGTTAVGVAGGYAGYEVGDKYGGKFGNFLYGDKIGATKQYLATVANIESGINPGAQAGTSSAKGMFQFTSGTWNSLAKKYNKDYLISGDQDYRGDTKKSLEMMKLLSMDNQGALEKKLGRPITDVELYMAHFLGPEGAGRVLQANSNTPGVSAADLLPSAAAANPDIFYNKNKARSVAELSELIAKKYGSKSAELGFGMNNKLTALPQGTLASLPNSDYSVPDNVLDAAAKAEASKSVVNSTLMSTAITNAMKSTSASKEKQNISINAGGGGNQSLFSDISTMHFLDGLLLNVYTDQ